jgi:hypothetical protein
MTAIATFIDKAIKGLPGCPYPLVQDTFLDVLIDFCERTWILDYEATKTVDVSVDVTAALNNSIEITTTALHADLLYFEPIVVDEIRVDGFPFHVKHRNLLTDSANPSAMFDVSTKYFFFSDTGKIKIFPIDETVDFELFLKIIFKPLKTITTIPTFIWEKWERYITAGVRSELQSIEGKPWSSNNKTVTNGALYLSGIVAAKSAGEKMYAGAPIMVTMRPWV